MEAGFHFDQFVTLELMCCCRLSDILVSCLILIMYKAVSLLEMPSFKAT